MMLPSLIQKNQRCDNCGKEIDKNFRDCIAEDEKRNIKERVIFCNKLNCIFDYAEKNKERKIKRRVKEK